MAETPQSHKTSGSMSRWLFPTDVNLGPHAARKNCLRSSRGPGVKLPGTLASLPRMGRWEKGRGCLLSVQMDGRHYSALRRYSHHYLLSALGLPRRGRNPMDYLAVGRSTPRIWGFPGTYFTKTLLYGGGRFYINTVASLFASCTSVLDLKSRARVHTHTSYVLLGSWWGWGGLRGPPRGSRPRNGATTTSELVLGSTHAGLTCLQVSLLVCMGCLTKRVSIPHWCS